MFPLNEVERNVRIPVGPDHSCFLFGPLALLCLLAGVLPAQHHSLSFFPYLLLRLAASLLKSVLPGI